MINENSSKKLKMMEEENLAKEKFNNITNSTTVENQNQNHNIKKQGLGPNTNR